jgi:hypothetical protein
MQKFLFILFINLFILQPTLFAQQNNVSLEADKYLTARTDLGRFSGAVLIAQGEKILLQKGYGAMPTLKKNRPSPQKQNIRSLHFRRCSRRCQF